MKKKAQLVNTFAGMFIILLGMVMTVIMGYLLYAVGHDYIVLELYNASTNTNYSSNIEAGFENIVIDYQATNLNIIDNMVMLAYGVMVILSLVVSYYTKEVGIFSLVGMLTYGTMFLLFMSGLFLVIVRWLYFDVLMNLFDNLIISTPKLEYIITNFPILFLINVVACIIINNIDLDFSSRSQRKKKERDSMDEEVL